MGETISRHFKKVLKAIVNLGKEVITPPTFADVPSEIVNNPKYYPWFKVCFSFHPFNYYFFNVIFLTFSNVFYHNVKDCVGAIDGTHVSASVTVKDQIPYRGRKISVTQNVMCACSFDMRFTFVYAGWEGTPNDSSFCGSYN